MRKDSTMLPYPKKEQIAALRDLFASPAAWIKNAEGGIRSVDGYEPCHYDNPKADCFDLLGGVARVCGFSELDRLAGWLVRVICPRWDVKHPLRNPDAKRHPFSILMDWNDHCSTTFSDLQEAIKKIAQDVKIRTS